MKIEKKKITELLPADYNPRKDLQPGDKEYDKLLKSIQEFDYVDPVIWNQRTGTVVGGHQRLKILQDLGHTEVEVSVVDLPIEKEMALNVALNKVSGDWDMSKLSDLFIEMQDMDIDMELTGFDMDEINNLMPDKIEDGLTDDDAVPEVPEEPRTKMGDIYKLGNHRLMCGDSTSIDAIEKLMDGEISDVIIFDPPYDQEELYTDAMLPPKDGRQKLIVMWDFKRFAIAPSKALDFGWNPLYEFIWDCVQSWYTPNRPLARHKAIGVFGDDPYFNTEIAIIKDGRLREAKTVKNTRGKCDYVPLNGAKHISTVEQFPNTQQTDEHGHGKPVVWIEAIFNGIGGTLYLDLFGGSGSTLIACEKTGRKARLMELSPHYCDVIVKRWEDYTGKKAELLPV